MALNRITRETFQWVGGWIAFPLVNGMISRFEIH